nr:hypothetical protein [Streptomyces liliifuscus]
MPVEGLAGDVGLLGQQGVGQPGRSDLRQQFPRDRQDAVAGALYARVPGVG